MQALDGPVSGDYFGHAVAGAGDVNHDGYADVIVGAYPTIPDGGSIYVYYGSPTGVSTNPDWVFHARLPGAFGHQVEGVGDVNGDGVDDVIVGATHWGGDPPKDVGAAFVFHGSTNGPGDHWAWEAHGEASDSRFGFTVAAAGDVNGDGNADVLVGSQALVNPRGDGARTSRGKAYLYFGGTNGLSTNAAWTAIGERDASQFGYTAHGAGDVNGDGFADVLIGDFGYGDAAAEAGKAYLYLGGSNGPSRKPDWTYTGRQARQTVGNSVFTAGDVNGDDFADVVIASNHWSHDQAEEGQILVFLGSSKGLPANPSWSFEPDQQKLVLGHSVATAGDLNGDGRSDLIASAFYGENGIWREGLAFVFHGSRQGLGSRPDWSMRGSQALGGFGSTVRAAGDLNRDGYGDVVIGHTFYSGSISNQGRVWIYYGSPQGLAGSINWHPPGKRYGIEIMDLPIPVPNLLWTAFLTVLALAFFAWLLLWLHRRGVRRALVLQAEREMAREAERRRLARDLHDHLGAELTHLPLPSAGAAKPRIAEQVSELVWLTKPANDTLANLARFLSEYAARALQTAGLRTDLDFPIGLPARAVPGEFRRELFYAFKEALANALKHARASQVRIRLAVSDNTLELAVQDDGCGFDPASTAPCAGHGNGLDNLRSRLRELGGTCEIRSAPGEGTHVTFRVALPV